MDQQQQARFEARHGVSFKTDLSTVGTRGGNSRLFTGSKGGSILDEEKRLIDKVFSIVDRDNSGSVDMTELKQMFKLFGVESHYLETAIQRIMANVDKDFDGMISPQEFHQLLSQKFDKDDPESDVKGVFNRMDTNKDGNLDANELHEVAQILGETIDKKEIQKMILMFNRNYQKELMEWKRDKKKNPNKPEPSKPKSIDFQDFLAVMQESLE